MRQILPRTYARINKSSFAQLPPCLQIVRPTLTLRIRPKRPATIRPLVPLNSQPAQIFHHRARKLRTRTLRVQILIPQHQNSLISARPLRRDPKRPRMTHMQQPRRRRRQPPAITGLRIRRTAERFRVHVTILVRTITPLCGPAHAVSEAAHGLAPLRILNPATSTLAALAAVLPYHFRLRQPQRR